MIGNKIGQEIQHILNITACANHVVQATMFFHYKVLMKV